MTVLRILVVDDDRDIRRMLSFLLHRKLGAQVLQAENGLVALAAAREQRPDLIVLDMLMPELDGWQTAAQLNANRETADIPLLALTVACTCSDQHRALDAGCDQFMSKPFLPADLVATIKAMLTPATRRAVN